MNMKFHILAFLRDLILALLSLYIGVKALAVIFTLIVLR
jgi:hypothetical protein